MQGKLRNNEELLNKTVQRLRLLPFKEENSDSKNQSVLSGIHSNPYEEVSVLKSRNTDGIQRGAYTLDLRKNIFNRESSGTINSCSPSNKRQQDRAKDADLNRFYEHLDLVNKRR